MTSGPQRVLTTYRPSSVRDQLVQLSVVGDVVDVAEPPVAVTPVNEGIEKNAFSHAAGAPTVMLPSFVKVTTRGLLDAPLEPTVSGEVGVCELPTLAVEKFQITSLGVAARHPVCVVVSALVV
jgi:hypothetical protein